MHNPHNQKSRAHIPARILQATFALTLLAGCKDPVATSLARQGKFGMVKPPSAGLVLGDIHESPDLTRPAISMLDVSNPSAMQAMMASRATAVNLQDATRDSSYSIDLSGSYPQVISAELQAKGASKYTIRYGKATQYDSTTIGHLNSVLLPMIRERFPVDLTGKYAIRSLLSVDSMEYQFTNSSGGKVNLAPDPALIGNIKAKLGAAWTINNAGSLVLTEPRFIGFRLARIDKDNFARAMAPGAPAEAQFVSSEVQSDVGTPRPKPNTPERKRNWMPRK